MNDKKDSEIPDLVPDELDANVCSGCRREPYDEDLQDFVNHVLAVYDNPEDADPRMGDVAAECTEFLGSFNIVPEGILALELGTSLYAEFYAQRLLEDDITGLYTRIGTVFVPLLEVQFQGNAIAVYPSLLLEADEMELVPTEAAAKDLAAVTTDTDTEPS